MTCLQSGCETQLLSISTNQLTTHRSVISVIQRAAIFLKNLPLDLVKKTKIHCHVLEEEKERNGERNKREKKAQFRECIYRVIQKF
jgi:hypothetical protein